MTDVPPLSHRRALTTILGCWLGYLVLLWLLGELGLGPGLFVWPMGEDRNWIDLLQRGDAGVTARGLWAIDHRNPLSPWWYNAFRPIILGWTNGLFLLRHAVGLALALASYSLVALWFGPGARAFGCALACLIAVSTFNAYFDQIYWNFLGSLVCSILSVIAYLRHLRAPGRGHWLALSLVLWLLAVATYTIQAGAIVVIALAVWLAETQRPLLPRLGVVVLATLPFFAVFVLFVLIWQTTSVPVDGFFIPPGPSRLLGSLRMGLFHEDIPLMWAVLGRSPHRFALAGAGIAVAVAIWAMLPKLGLAERPPLRVGLIVLIALGLAAPTLAVETIGGMWTPGSRWRMIYQFTTPALYLGFLALLATWIGKAFWRAGVAALFGAALTLSIAHNERQVAVTKSERAFYRTIAADSERLGSQPLQYLLLIDRTTHWQAADYVSTVYARTWFRNASPSFRLIPGPLYWGAQAGAKVTFLPDAEGVANATVDGRTLPYAQIRIVRAENGRYNVLDRLDRADLEGFRAEWQRDSAIDLRR